MVKPIVEMFKHFPWEFAPEHDAVYEARMIRLHGEYMATGGKEMGRQSLADLQVFYLKMQKEDLVLEYHPGIDGGFAYHPRQSSDADLLVRVNELTKMTPLGRVIWRFPPKFPGASDAL